MDDQVKKETMLFVALPGAEPYAEMPRKAVKAQLDKGQLKQSALIWSQKHNAWKQARYITQLIASKLEPRPVQARIGGVHVAQPHVHVQAKAAQPAAGATASPAAATPVQAKAATPQVKQVAAVKAAAQASTPVETTAAATSAPAIEDYTFTESSHASQVWLKAICGGLVALIVILLAFNWYYVDNSLKANLAEDNSEFKDVAVYAHLGGFFQIDSIIIHIRPSDKVTKENFVKYLAALSAATPDRPLSRRSFSNVILTSGWSADYQVDGLVWHRIGRSELSDDERHDILFPGLRQGGASLVPKSVNLDYNGLQALREKRWNEFISTFVSK
jgi:hypothetical protein